MVAFEASVDDGSVWILSSATVHVTNPGFIPGLVVVAKGSTGFAASISFVAGLPLTVSKICETFILFTGMSLETVVVRTSCSFVVTSSGFWVVFVAYVVLVGLDVLLVVGCLVTEAVVVLIVVVVIFFVGLGVGEGGLFVGILIV